MVALHRGVPERRRPAGPAPGRAPAVGGLGEPLTFTQGAEVGNFFPDQCPPPTKNAVHWMTIDGKWDVLAYVFLCPREPTDRVTSFQLVFDRDEDRYWGTGDA